MSARPMTLEGLVTGNSQEARKFRALCQAHGLLNTPEAQQTQIIEFVADATFGGGRDSQDWLKELQLEHDVYAFRGEPWFDRSQPWQFHPPSASVPLPPNKSYGYPGAAQIQSLGAVLEVVKRYGVVY